MEFRFRRERVRGEGRPAPLPVWLSVSEYGGELLVCLDWRVPCWICGVPAQLFLPRWGLFASRVGGTSDRISSFVSFGEVFIFIIDDNWFSVQIVESANIFELTVSPDRSLIQEKLWNVWVSGNPLVMSLVQIGSWIRVLHQSERVSLGEASFKFR